MTTAATAMAPQRRNGDDEPRFVKSVKTLWPIFGALIIVVGNYFVMGYRVDQIERRLSESPTRIEMQSVNTSLLEIKESMRRIEDRQYQQAQQGAPRQQGSVKGSNGGSR